MAKNFVVFQRGILWGGIAFIVALFLLNINFICAEEVIKKTDVIRGMDVEESVYYVGDKEVAKEKISKDGLVEQSGKIPDGKIKFSDQYKDTYGEENYKNGKRKGVSRTFYKSGKLMKEFYYDEGRLIKGKEYFENGNIRYEVDYQDARYDAKGTKNKEVGIGKLYYPTGVLKYEWNVTKSQMIGYKRSYNQDGALRAETQVDDKGNIISPQPVDLMTSGNENQQSK